MDVFWFCIGKISFGLYFSGTQLSVQKFIDLPSPILQSPPFQMTSLPLIMLFQAWEAEFGTLPSIIEQSGKNLGLNTR